MRQSTAGESVAVRKTDLEGSLLLLDELDAVHLHLPFVTETFDVDRGLFDHGLVAIRADDVLEVLEQAFLVHGGALGLHLRDRLDFALCSEMKTSVSGGLVCGPRGAPGESGNGCGSSRFRDRGASA